MKHFTRIIGGNSTITMPAKYIPYWRGKLTLSCSLIEHGALVLTDDEDVKEKCSFIGLVGKIYLPPAIVEKTGFTPGTQVVLRIEERNPETIIIEKRQHRNSKQQ